MPATADVVAVAPLAAAAAFVEQGLRIKRFGEGSGP